MVRNELAETLGPDPANANATEYIWNPNMDYYTVENAMTPTPAGIPAHPGLARPPGTLQILAQPSQDPPQ